jgi:trimeric autotransporter adhesin
MTQVNTKTTIGHIARCGVIASALLTVAAVVSPCMASAERIGVVAAVNSTARAKIAGGTAQDLMIGQEIVVNERIRTGTDGQVLIWFVDGSSLSVGPNSKVVVDKFIFDPNTGVGQLALRTCAGVARYVGGKISKHENSVTLATPVGVVGVRGGVFIMTAAPAANSALPRRVN